MKKKSFLSGIGAKLALAAVALTTVVFTSCEKEEFNVEPIALSPASASILAIVYDQTTGEVLGTQPTTIPVGEDGTIAKQTVTVTCPTIENAAAYLPVSSIEIEVPKVGKGQIVLIPVNFYALKITSAAQNITTSKDEVQPATPETNKTSEEYIGTGKPQIVDYDALVGTKVLNKTEVYANIETLVNSRAMSNENIIAVLKALVNSYDNMDTKKIQIEVNMPAGTTFVFKPKTSMTTYTMSLTATVDGAEYIIPNMKMQEAGATNANLEILSHGHGHGDSGNAGGGAGGK